jgi:hypothetical protein
LMAKVDSLQKLVYHRTWDCPESRRERSVVLGELSWLSKEPEPRSSEWFRKKGLRAVQKGIAGYRPVWMNTEILWTSIFRSIGVVYRDLCENCRVRRFCDLLCIVDRGKETIIDCAVPDGI